MTDDEILDVACKYCEFTPEGTYHLRKYSGKWAIVCLVRECIDRSIQLRIHSGITESEDGPDEKASPGK